MPTGMVAGTEMNLGYDFFTGRDAIPKSMADLRNRYQYDENKHPHIT